MAQRRAIAVLVTLASLAWPALSSARISGRRAAQVRASLAKQIRRHPGVVTQRWFLRKAGLVQFKLPVTLRVRSDPAPAATVDLGPSLGSRSIALGGSLAASVTFSDSFDGGVLGNVGIEFQQSDAQFLRTSSIPLLWNTDVSDPATRSDANVADASGLSVAGQRQGCGDFTAAGTNGDGSSALFHGLPQELPGYPYYDAAGPGGLVTPAGYLPIRPGVDAIDNLKQGSVVGDNDWLGPGQEPNVEDTVLRTNALQLQVADRGTGGSGGQANLFGNIPGKNVSVDVTLSLKTVINAIMRVVDQDVSRLPLEAGEPYPDYVLQCRQLWTGALQNTIPGLKLRGQLRISPAITPDGHLRIATATVSSPPATPARAALSACLIPVATYAAGTDDPAIPSPRVVADTERFAPSDVLGANAPSGTPCSAQDGSRVTVAGDVSVDQVSVDVLIGDV